MMEGREFDRSDPASVSIVNEEMARRLWRTREIGIRLALGASAHQVQRLMARSGLKMAVAGIGFGVPAALASTRALEGILFGTSPTDPAVFTVVTLILGLVAVAASWLPARRAARVDPLIVLRAE